MLTVALLNFCVNFLLLVGANRLDEQDTKMIPTLFASIVGAVYAALCVMPELWFLAAPFWRVVSLCLIAFLAYGPEKGTWKRGAVFVLLNLALGGTALALGQGNGWPLLAYAVLVQLLSRFALSGRRLVPVEIAGNGASVQLTALRDTGNELRDPITGERVLVIGKEAAKVLTGLTAEQLANPLDTIAEGKIPGLRLIPYSAVGTEKGMLLAMRFPRVRIGKRERAGLVAFAPSGLDGEQYQSLAGGF